VNRTWTTLFTLLALSLGGCGKSESDLKIEAEMNEQIDRLHDEGMLLVKSFTDLEREIGAAQSIHDSLARVHPGLFSVEAGDKLAAAEHQLDSARLAMKTWMREHKRYDSALPHREAVDLLTREKEGLLSITNEMKAASAAANNALATYRQVLEQEETVKPSGLGN
jgi:hypothetical protein